MHKNSGRMKQSYIKAAEEAIKKAEDIKHRFQTQSRLVPGKDPDLLLEEEGFAEQIGCLHRIARIDREEAAEGETRQNETGEEKGPDPADSADGSSSSGSDWSIPVSVDWEPGETYR